MKKYVIPKDRFHQNEPQVTSHILPPEPPDLPSIDSDESRGGVNPAPIIREDEGFNHAFKPEREHKDPPVFYRRGK